MRVRFVEMVKFGIRWLTIKFEYEELDGVRAEAARIAAREP